MHASTGHADDAKVGQFIVPAQQLIAADPEIRSRPSRNKETRVVLVRLDVVTSVGAGYQVPRVIGIQELSGAPALSISMGCISAAVDHHVAFRATALSYIALDAGIRTRPTGASTPMRSRSTRPLYSGGSGGRAAASPLPDPLGNVR